MGVVSEDRGHLPPLLSPFPSPLILPNDSKVIGIFPREVDIKQAVGSKIFPKMFPQHVYIANY